MGKPKKFLKGFSNGRALQYGHAVNMVLSEGLGSSGRVDQGITLSDVSCIPKKPFNLDTGYGDQFGVPFEVLMLSCMSKAERRKAVFKLKRELEEVRLWQSKLASLDVDVMDLSPSSVCSVGRKRPISQGVILEQPAGKKSATKGRNGCSVPQRVPPSHVDSLKRNVPVVSSTSLMKQCSNLLAKMMSHKFGGHFNTPVDAVKLNIPDYHTIIKHPMDFSTIKDKIATGKYSDPLGFAADVRLTLSNAMTYNPVGNRFHAMAKTLSSYFEKLWKPIEKKIPTDSQLQQPLNNTNTSNKLVEESQSLMTKRLPRADSKFRPAPGKNVMTIEDKQKLSLELESVLSELPSTIIEFLKDNSSSAGQSDDDEIEIDIGALNDETLIKLRKLLDDFLIEKKNAKSNSGAATTEDGSVLGLSNPLIQSCKGNDADDDIDICGNDSPVLRFSPVQIENAGHPNNSSSHSDSSSSDSDSGSSSDSESEGKAATCVTSLQEVRDDDTLAGKHMESQDSGASTSECPNGQVEHNIAQKSLLQDEDVHLEGENAPSVRQLSPEKVYRAALLKSRFADTILKAQEKACEKDVTIDSEKSRLEREEREKRRKQEKARLQAEAKAAEEARKKAAAWAAAEAKRTRELEREAARMALEKMEKTVNINEQCVLMEDLEVLNSSISAGVDDLSNGLVEDASPNNSENILGSFKLEGKSNVLEQLGLYMKADDVEEEEDEDAGGAPVSTLDHVNDV